MALCKINVGRDPPVSARCLAVPGFERSRARLVDGTIPPVPKLGDYEWILDVTFFLYPSGSDAAVGRQAGGTGFLVALPSMRAPDRFHHVYGVTNRHLAARSPVVRINRHAGPPT